MDIGACDGKALDSLLNHQAEEASVNNKIGNPDVPKEKKPRLRKRLSDLRDKIIPKLRNKFSVSCG